MTEEKNKNEELQVYEIGFHVISTLTEQEADVVVDVLRKGIVDMGGSLISEGTLEHIDLAYKMSINEGGKHTYYDKAYFGWIKFEIEPEKVEELKSEIFDSTKEILRYLLIKTVKEETRAQLKEETLRSLEEVKTDSIIEQKTEDEDSSPVSDEEIDKVVDELLADAEEQTDDKKDA